MIKIDRILTALDASPIAEGAASFALQIAQKRQAEVHLLTVDVLPEGVLGGERAPETTLEEVSQEFRKQTDRLIEEANLTDSGLTIRHEAVRANAAAPGIVQYAEEHDIDLIVTGTHGWRGVRRALIGSVAAEVLRTAPCPALTVRTGEGNPPDAVRTILVPIDFSKPSQGAVNYAAGLAELFGAELLITHVMEDVDSTDEYSLKPSAIGTGEGYRRIQHRLNELCKEVPGQSSCRVLTGNPAEEIASYATEKSANLIVMPTRGQAGWQRILMGSVAEQVITTAPCPVVSAKDFDPYVQVKSVTTS